MWQTKTEIQDFYRSSMNDFLVNSEDWKELTKVKICITLHQGAELSEDQSLG